MRLWGGGVVSWGKCKYSREWAIWVESGKLEDCSLYWTKGQHSRGRGKRWCLGVGKGWRKKFLSRQRISLRNVPQWPEGVNEELFLTHSGRDGKKLNRASEARLPRGTLRRDGGLSKTLKFPASSCSDWTFTCSCVETPQLGAEGLWWWHLSFRMSVARGATLDSTADAE